MMKRIVSMLLLTGTLLIENTVFAFYADEALLLILGWFNLIAVRQSTLLMMTARRILLFMTIGSFGLRFGIIESEDQWHQWEFGLQQQSHMEQLASCGFYALKTLGKL